MKVRKGEPDVRATMEPLERLDLSKVNTVGGLVRDMRKCSFGARMLGNVAETLVDWCQNHEPKPTVIYDGSMKGSIFEVLNNWVKRGWITQIMNSDHFASRDDIGMRGNTLVIGECTSRHLGVITERTRDRIFINKSGQASPGQYRDGHFPNLVPSDPAFIVPVLNDVLEERICGIAYRVSDLFNRLLPYGDLADETARGGITLLDMVHDPDTTTFMTLSGAMTVAKMGLLIDDMIRLGMMDYVSSTGALMAHGLIEGIGLKHYAYDPKFPDDLLARQGLNRVTDALEPEENFDHIDEIVNDVLRGYSGKRPISPSRFHADIGRYLKRKFPGERAILKSAYERKVPILVPAFVDSEIGNDVFVHNLWRRRRRMPQIVFNPELDTRVLLDMAIRAKRLGIFSIGGGVPRNNTQNVAPLIEIANARLKLGLPRSMFYYGCRIDPTPLYYGNLSGCTYSEGGSWRKFDLDGMLTEVHADATIVWPFILKYVLEKFTGRQKPNLRKRFALR